MSVTPTTNPVKKNIGIIIGALIIAAAIIVAVIILRPKETINENTTPLVTMENVNEIEEDVKEQVERGMFATRMNTTWVFPDGNSPSSNAVMGNSASNRFPFYFTVTLNDTGEEVFASGVLPLGTEIAEIKLNKNLPAGTYPATVHLHMIDEDGEIMKGSMGLGVTLIVNS